MVADLSTWGSQLFPTMRLSLRRRARSRQMVLPPAVQALALVLALISAAGLGYLTFRCVADEHAAGAARAAEMRLERANLDLQDAIAALRDKLDAVTRDREHFRHQLAALASPPALPAKTAKAQPDELPEPRAPFSPRETAQQQPAAAQSAPPTAGQLAQLTELLEQTRKELGQEKAQNASLAARLRELEQRLSPGRTNRSSQPMSPAAPASPAAGLSDRGLNVARTAAPGPPMEAEPAPGQRGLGEVARALASTGLSLKQLLKKLGGGRAEGGPFVPPPKGGDLPNAISSQQLLALAKTLPISLPLADSRETSSFGIRRDPFNRRPEFHTGIDLAAPYMTPVYATAPGTVSYVGWRGAYGKVVEIDHGDGVSTRYGHLHRYTVLLGQRVAAHTRIGFVGSTGRSTGPHLHYEVLVDDKPQNPETFLSLAHLIPVAAQ